MKAERASLAAMTPAFDVARAQVLKTPLIFASPHSGNIYPQSFTHQSPLPLATLRRNEDAFIHTLFAPVVEAGAALLCARFPRCFVDANRAPDELPFGWGGASERPTARTKAGYGVIPLIIAENTPIYKKPLPEIIAKGRMGTLYHPYHAALRTLIDEAKDSFGRALVIDCHSMPGFAPMGARRADIVLGDRYGMSCAPQVIEVVETAFKTRGYSVTRNYPYAGGYVTEHYGQPATGVEAVQIEINRDLYLNPVTLAAKPKPYQALADDLRLITAEIINTLGDDRDLSLAAE